MQNMFINSLKENWKNNIKQLFHVKDANQHSYSKNYYLQLSWVTL